MLHKLAGKGNVAVFVRNARLAQRIAADGGHRQKRGPPAVALLQKADGVFGVLLAFDNDILQARAERDLNGDRIALVHPHQICDRAAHTAQLLLLRRLHNQAHRLVEPLVLLFHLAEQADA